MLRKVTCAGLTCIASLIFGQAVEEYGPPLPPALPELYCPEPIFDWGEALDGDTIEHTYEIFNKGSAPLFIENVKTACGCASSKFDKEIAPGGKGAVALRLITRGYGGANPKKTAQIISNDPSKKEFTLTIGGEVRSVMKLDPERPALEGLCGQPLSTKIKLIRNIGKPVKIISVNAQATSWITHELVETRPGEEYELTVTLDVKDKTAVISPYGRLTVMVQVEDKTIETSVVLRINRVDTVRALPTSVTLRAYELEAYQRNPSSVKPSRAVVLKSWQNKPFKVTGLEVKAGATSLTPGEQGQTSEPPVSATLEGDPATGECMVKIDAIKFQDEESRGRPVRSDLTVRTDDPATPEVVIPITVYFPVKGQPAMAGKGASPSAPRLPPANRALSP